MDDDLCDALRVKVTLKPGQFDEYQYFSGICSDQGGN
jgi:hypothetical protein